MNNPLAIPGKYLIAAACILSCFFMAGCENDEREINEWTQDRQMVEEATKVESYLSQDGHVKAKLKAPLMLRVLGDTLYVEFTRSLHVDFYDDSSRIESWLDSKYGKYFESLNKVYLRDSVVVISMKGDTLRCHDLWWDQNKELFYTDSVATYHSPNNKITGGRGMEASQDFKSVTFKYPLGTVQIGGDGFAQ
ncbi:MAG: LPS export ABC transporter periplasmic protein LptC [Chitinophagaceae bacterium]